MNAPDHAVVRFACPRCLTRLVAPASQAGTKRRCPQCQRVFEVPTAAEVARHHRDPGQYHVAEGMAAAAEDEPHLTVVCPLCRSVLRAGENEVGRELICPDCGTPSLVVAPARAEKKAAPPLAALDAYALHEEVEGEPPHAWTEPPRYVPMTCPVCRTFLQVPENLLGSQIHCPDCLQAMTVVRRAEADKAKAVVPEDLGEYALHADGADSSASPAAGSYRTLCPLCRSLIYVEPHQAGRHVICPDCRTSFVAPRPPAPKRRRNLAAEAGELYGLGDAVETPEYQPADVTPRWRIGSKRSSADREQPPDPPPRWTFFSGVFGLPLYRNSWQKWLGLSAGLLLPLWLGRTAWTLAMAQAGPWLGATPWIGSLVLCGTTAVLGAIWACIAFSSMLSILRDTAYGRHQIEDWPENVFVDWMGEILFLLTSLGLSVLPGVLVAGATQSAGEATGLCVAIGLIVLFPVNLLATLETNSPLNPFSPPVWRSLLAWWWAWAVFYVETALLLAAGGGLALLAVTQFPRAGIALASPLLVATLMIYFRLLGRLAWRCSGAAEPGNGRRPEADESAAT